MSELYPVKDVHRILGIPRGSIDSACRNGRIKYASIVKTRTGQNSFMMTIPAVCEAFLAGKLRPRNKIKGDIALKCAAAAEQFPEHRDILLQVFEALKSTVKVAKVDCTELPPNLKTIQQICDITGVNDYVVYAWVQYDFIRYDEVGDKCYTIDGQPLHHRSKILIDIHNFFEDVQNFLDDTKTRKTTVKKIARRCRQSAAKSSPYAKELLAFAENLEERIK